MPWRWRKSLASPSQVIEEIPQAAVNITIGQVVYWSVGFITNATGGTTLNTDNIAGVAMELSSNSGGAAGDLAVNVCVDPWAVYEAECDAAAENVAAARGQSYPMASSSLVLVDLTTAGVLQNQIAFLRMNIRTTFGLYNLNFHVKADV